MANLQFVGAASDRYVVRTQTSDTSDDASITLADTVLKIYGSDGQGLLAQYDERVNQSMT